MYIGAVIIAAGCGDSPMLPAGGICVAQRMIASFRKAGVDLIAVITGPDDKKMEKQLMQAGVFFLQNPNPEDKEASALLGLGYLQGKCSQIFLIQADRPLIAPETLHAMIGVCTDIVIPTCCDEEGRPVLLSKDASLYVIKHGVKCDTTGILETRYLAVEDPGILLPPVEACKKEDALSDHNRKLTRPVMEVSISRGKNFLDTKLMILLHLIQETQSVRDACARMQISYSTAWNILNHAEDELGYPLLMRNKGGPSGSGSLLTEKGKDLLNAYEQFQFAAKENMEKLYDTYLASVLR